MLYHGAPARGFMDAISTCLNKYITFSGRASRSEYWFFFLFTLITGAITAIFDAIVFGIDDDSSFFAPLAYLVLFLPGLAAQFRRLHDTGHSGWWVGVFWCGLPVWGYLLLWILENGSPAHANRFTGISVIGALVYFLIMLIFLCQRGDLVKNRFG